MLRIWDPGSGAFLILTPGSGIGKKSGSGSGMNNPNLISESLETIFWVKILKSWMRIRARKNTDTGWKKFGSGIKNKHPGSATLLKTNVWLGALDCVLYFKFSLASLPNLGLGGELGHLVLQILGELAELVLLVS